MIPALLFGGAFNPPTIAHLSLAEYAMNRTGKQCVVFVPSKNSYIRDTQHKSFAFSDDERLAMLEKCAEKRDWMRVSDWEINARKQPRTYETLVHLREEGYQCSLLFGSDKLGELQTVWKYVEEIGREFGMVCIARAEDDPKKMIAEDPYLSTLKPCIQVIPAMEETKNMSSTQVRTAIQEIAERLNEIRQVVPEELTSLIFDYAEGEVK